MEPSAIASAAGVRTFGEVETFGDEAWLWGANWQSLVVVQDGAVVPPYEGPLQRLDRRVVLYGDGRFVELEQRGDDVLVRRGLLNGRFHVGLSSTSLEVLTAHYEAHGFARGRTWSSDSRSSTLRVFWENEEKKGRGAFRIRVDGATVTVEDLSQRKETTEEAADHDEAAAWADALVAKLEAQNFRTHNVEVVEANRPNPRGPNEPEPREPIEKTWVDWRPPERVVSFDRSDVDAALRSAPPSLIELEPREAKLRELDASQPIDRLLASLGFSRVTDLVVFATLVRRQAEPDAPVSIDGCWTPDGPTVVVGDLTLEGDLQLVRSLVVTGDLVVKGHVDHPDGAALVVLGAFSARSVLTEGPLVVAGATTVQSVLYGTYNDHCAELHGPLTAGMVVSDEHAIVTTGPSTLRHRPDAAGSWGSDVFDTRQHWDAILQLLGPENHDRHRDTWAWDFVPPDL